MNKRILAGLIAAIAVIAAIVYLIVPTPLSAECQASQQQLKQQIGQLNYCSVTEDCEAQALYCPFDCWVFTNRQANFAPVKAQIDAYGSGCGVCALSCPSIPPKPDCIEGKCVFE